MKLRRWLITGASRGIGRRCAELLLKLGHQAQLVVRDPESVRVLLERYPASVQVIGANLAQLDWTQEDLGAHARSAPIDVLLNCAGEGLLRCWKECSPLDIAAQTNLNFVSPATLSALVAENMSAVGSGLIVNVSSFSGHIASPALGPYSAAKAALSSLSDSLRSELEPYGVSVVELVLGAIRTEWSQRARARHGELIDTTSTALSARMGAMFGSERGDPLRVAQIVFALSQVQSVPAQLFLGTGESEALLERLRARAELLCANLSHTSAAEFRESSL